MFDSSEICTVCTASMLGDLLHAQKLQQVSDEIQILRLIRHRNIVFTASMASLWVGIDIYVQHKKSVNVRVVPRIWDLLSSIHLNPAYTVLILDVTDVDLILQAGDIENPPILLPMSREGPMPLDSSSFSSLRWASEDEYHLDPALTGCTTCISLHISSCQTYSEELRFLVAKKITANKFISPVKFMRHLCSHKYHKNNGLVNAFPSILGAKIFRYR